MHVCVHVQIHVYKYIYIYVDKHGYFEESYFTKSQAFKYTSHSDILKESTRISFKLSSGQQNETKSSVEFIVIIQDRPMAMHASQVQRSGVIFTELATGESLE